MLESKECVFDVYAWNAWMMMMRMRMRREENVQVFIPFQSMRGCRLDREEPVQTCLVRVVPCILEERASLWAAATRVELDLELG